MAADDTKKEAILKYMEEYGAITPLDAWQQFGCFSLAQRIYDLKKEGYRIASERVTKINAQNKRITYAQYRLENEDELEEY